MLKCKEKGISLSVLKVIRISHDETIIWCVFCKRNSKSITKCISNYIRLEDANNSGAPHALGMKRLSVVSWLLASLKLLGSHTSFFPWTNRSERWGMQAACSQGFSSSPDILYMWKKHTKVNTETNSHFTQMNPLKLKKWLPKWQLNILFMIHELTGLPYLCHLHNESKAPH